MTFANRQPGGGVVGGVGGPAVGLDLVRRPSMIGPTMSPRKWTGRPPGRPKGPKLEQLTVYLEPRQAATLRRRAAAAAKARGVTRPDVSAMLREAIDVWLKTRRKKVEVSP